jgi:hypothetical protein
MKRIVLPLVLLAALAAPLSAASFGTINSLGQRAEHERITRAGLARAGFDDRTLDALAGRDGSFGAVGAPDNPLRGLMSDPAAHCDGADHLAAPGYPRSAATARRQLEACRAFIVRNLDAAVVSAGRLAGPNGAIAAGEASMSPDCVFNGRSGRAKCEVLDHLGQALHASQDFYSHSNWVDAPRPGAPGLDNPPGLNQRGPAPWLHPDGTAPFPAGLITGCYDGFPEALHCRGRVRHASLNKDTGEIDVTEPQNPLFGAGTTDRGRINENFQNAAQAAIADTARLWGWFEAQVTARYGAERGRRILCAIRSDDTATCP